MSTHEYEGVTRRGFFSLALIAVPTISVMTVLAAEPAIAGGDGPPKKGKKDKKDKGKDCGGSASTAECD